VTRGHEGAAPDHHDQHQPLSAVEDGVRPPRSPPEDVTRLRSHPRGGRQGGSVLHTHHECPHVQQITVAAVYDPGDPSPTIMTRTWDRLARRWCRWCRDRPIRPGPFSALNDAEPDAEVVRGPEVSNVRR